MGVRSPRAPVSLTAAQVHLWQSTQPGSHLQGNFGPPQNAQRGERAASFSSIVLYSWRASCLGFDLRARRALRFAAIGSRLWVMTS